MLEIINQNWDKIFDILALSPPAHNPSYPSHSVSGSCMAELVVMEKKISEKTQQDILEDAFK